MSANAEHETPVDNDYASRTGQSQVPVQKDEADVVDPIDPATADSDETLGMSFHNHLAPSQNGIKTNLLTIVAADEKDAIDENNIIDEKTRGAGPKGGYAEPGDDEVRSSIYPGHSSP